MAYGLKAYSCHPLNYLGVSGRFMFKHKYHRSSWGTQACFRLRCAAGKVRVDPYLNQFSNKKWPFHTPIGLIFDKIFFKFEPSLAQIWAKLGSNLGEFWKYWPIHKLNFAFYIGPLMEHITYSETYLIAIFTQTHLGTEYFTQPQLCCFVYHVL